MTSQPPKGSEPGPMAMFGVLTGIGVVSAVLVAGGAACGYVVDGLVGTPHVFTFAGLVLGLVAAVLAVRDIYTRFFRS